MLKRNLVTVNKTVTPIHNPRLDYDIKTLLGFHENNYSVTVYTRLALIKFKYFSTA